MSLPGVGSPSGLLIRHGEGGSFRVPEVTGYAGEDQLQEMLFRHPDLVPGVTSPAVACREFQSGAGPADVLIIGSDGSLVVVECKLASNPQVRREVMGQVELTRFDGRVGCGGQATAVTAAAAAS